MNKMIKTLSIFSFLLFVSISYSQNFLDADATGDAYTRITSKLFAYEVPDCNHHIAHITEEWNTDLKKYAFIFGLHVTSWLDDDRCGATDRQRTEIKTYDASPDSMKGFYGETFTFRWKFKLDAGFQPSTSFTHIHQLKPGDGPLADNPHVTLTAVFKNSVNKLQIRFGHLAGDGSYDYVYEGSLTPLLGVWVEATEVVKYDSVAGTYSLVIKRVDNEQVIVNYNNSSVAMWRTGSTFIRPKWGIYRSLDHPDQLRDEYVLFNDFSMDKGTLGTAPPAPSSLSTSCLSEGRIILTWTDGSLTEDQFRIDRSTNAGVTWVYYAPAAKNSTTFTDTVSAANTYYYRIRAENTFGNSAFSGSASYNYVPIDYFYSKSSGNLEVIGNWGSNTDGSGIAPAFFSNSGRKYVIRNRSTATIGAAWTIADISTGSKIIVGDGTTACNFTVPSSYTVSGTIDVSANSTLIWTNAASPALGTLNSASTVNYNQSGSYTIPSTTLSYGNLKLTNGTKLFSPVTYTIAGNLIFDGATNCNGGASPFTTINLSGNYTLQNSAAFDTAQANRITLVCNGSTSQTLTGNNKEIILARLTISNTAGVVLSNSSGSNLTVGNLSGGGISFTTIGNFLNVNNNKVTFYAGKASLVGTGTFTAGTNAEFVFNNITSSTNAMGTFSLTGGSQVIKNLTLNLASTTAADKILILGSSATLTGSLTLTSGYLTTSSANLLTLGSSASVSGGNLNSFVNGPVGRTFAASGSALFPIGKITPSNSYRPVTLGVTQGSGTNVFTAEQKEGANPSGSTLASTLSNISSIRYITFSKSGTATVSAANLMMSYDADDGVGTNNAKLRIAHDSGGVWRDLGGTGSGPTTGTILSIANFTTFGDFVLAKATSASVLTLTAFLEGVTNSGGTAMRNDFWPITVTAELHDGSTLAFVEAQTGVLSTAGVGTFNFTTAVNGTPYYIVVKSDNTVETWSAAAQSFTSNALSYNFASAQTQAYGSNMIQKGSGAWCIFSGDVSKDATNIVDGSDVIAIDNDNTYGITTSAVTDITGDGIVDGSDVINVDNNNTYGISRQAPPEAPVARRVIRPGITQKQNIK
jgi:hypothetical protein